MSAQSDDWTGCGWQSEQRALNVNTGATNKKTKSIEDEGLKAMSQKTPVSRVKKLRHGIREHQDTSGHGVC